MSDKFSTHSQIDLTRRDMLKALGGAYVLAAVPIDNAAANGLAPDGVFERPDSPWRIHLYRVL